MRVPTSNSSRPRIGRRLFLAAGCAALLCGAVPPARAEGELSSTHISALAEPATVRIWIEVKAPITGPKVSPNWDLLRGAIQGQIQEGRLNGTSERDVTLAALNLILDQPDTYLSPGPETISLDTGFNTGGSGFILTPDGTVVTNAHVAAMADEEVKTQLAIQGLKQYVEENLAELKRLFGGEVPEELQKRFVDVHARIYLNQMSLGSVEKKINVIWGKTDASGTVVENSVPATLVKAGAAIPGKDVAILKIEGSNFPTLPLADDSEVRSGDQVYVLGFPGVVLNHPLLSKDSKLDPTFTRGVMSPPKRMEAGWNVIQMDAAITHGNSGGPALNSDGKVLGIATFISKDMDTGADAPGFNFVVPASVVREFLSGGEASDGPFDQAYRQGLNLFYERHYRAALDLLRKADAAAPGYPAVRRVIQDAEKAIAAGKEKSEFPVGPVAAGVAGGGVLLGSLFWLSRRRAAHSGPGTLHPPTSPRPSAGTAGGVGVATPPAPATFAPPAPRPAPNPAPAAGSIGLRLRLSNGITVPLTAGGRLPAAALPGLTGSGADGFVAEVSAHPSQSHIFGLRNLSTTAWQVVAADGGVREVQPGQSARLAAGVQLRLGALRATVEAEGPAPVPAAPSRTLYLASGKTLALSLGTQFQDTDLPGLLPTVGTRVVAEVAANPKDPNVLGLKNLTNQPWSAILPDGTTRQVPPGRSVRIAAGTRIQFGPHTAEIR